MVDKAASVITHDAGSPRDQTTPFWQSTTPLSYIGWGDAAIGFTGMDFETAACERIPILFNNFSMAIEIPIMPLSQEKYGAIEISGRYADMAKAFGGCGERITDPNDIVAALARGIEATENGQPALLEFITDQETTLSNE